VRTPARYDDYVAFESFVDERETYDPEVQFEHPLSLAASSDPDVMYLQQALKEPDRLEFIKAMEKEVRSHTGNANWKIINRSAVPRFIRSFQRLGQCAASEILLHSKFISGRRD
jgi:hypothetical protein